jgi:hypothetical protein
MPPLTRISLSLLRLALLACLPLWLAGHFLSARLTLANPTTLSSFSLRIGSGIGLGRAPSDNRFPRAGPVEATFTLCDRDASVLYHSTFPSPIDLTRIPLPYLEAPFWLLIPALAAAIALLRHHQRRLARGANLCPHCSYPLADLPPNSPCPECGRSTKTKRAGLAPGPRP